MVILDVAHNPASISALLEALENQLPERCTAGHRTVIIAISRDKDHAAILHLLLTSFDRIIVTRFLENPRATPIDQLLTIVRHIQSTTTKCGGRNGARQTLYSNKNHTPQTDCQASHSVDIQATMAGLRPGSCEILAADTPRNAWELAKELLQPNDVCVITGSVFLVSELRPVFVRQ
jgi:folylpolyglutamate synthase/dihydropteroate synthase